ncbi:hypothetical protein AKJ18_28930, partial [Vibrio xuii]
MNHHIEQSLDTPIKATLIVVGRKLYNLMKDDADIYAQLDGPNVVEEVPTVLDKMIQVFAKLQQQQPLMSLYSVYHSGEQGIISKKLLPPFQQQPQYS